MDKEKIKKILTGKFKETNVGPETADWIMKNLSLPKNTLEERFVTNVATAYGKDMDKPKKLKDSTERLLKRDDIADPLVHHPSHYTMASIEVVDFIDAQNDIGVSHNILCAIEYLCRAPWKGNQIQDLEKAIWRAQHEIDRLKREDAKNGRK